MKRILFLLPLLVAVAGCTDAKFSRWTALGKPQRITLYSGGRAVREWVSTGKVSTESDSDGWYFKDSKSGELIRVSGDVVIEPYVESERKPQA